MWNTGTIRKKSKFIKHAKCFLGMNGHNKEVFDINRINEYNVSVQLKNRRKKEC